MAQAVFARPGLDRHVHPGAFFLVLQKLRGDYLHFNLFIIKATEAADCVACVSKTAVNFHGPPWHSREPLTSGDSF